MNNTLKIIFAICILSLLALDVIKANPIDDKIFDEAIKYGSTQAGVMEKALWHVCKHESLENGKTNPYVTGDDGKSHGACQIQANTAIWMDNHYQSIGLLRLFNKSISRTDLIIKLYIPKINAFYGGPSNAKKYISREQFIPKHFLKYIRNVKFY